MLLPLPEKTCSNYYADRREMSLAMETRSMLDLTHRPPVARRVDRETDDPYAWLRGKDDPATLDHLNAENAYAEQVMRLGE